MQAGYSGDEADQDQDNNAGAAIDESEGLYDEAEGSERPTDVESDEADIAGLLSADVNGSDEAGCCHALAIRSRALVTH